MRKRSGNLILGVMGLWGCAAGCSGAPDPGEHSERPVETATEAVHGSSVTPVNSPQTLEHRLLPGIGYLDGTTCDIWPRALSFKDSTSTATGAINAVLSRVSASQKSAIASLEALSSRLALMNISSATAIGSKRRLDVTYGTLPNNQSVLIAFDALSGKGYVLENSLLCSEATMRINPLNCQEQTAVIGGKKYQVLARTIPANAGIQLPNSPLGVPPQETVVLVAPDIRFAPPSGSSQVVANVQLIAIGERVYGGAVAGASEDVTKRTSSLVSLRVAPKLPAVDQYPTTNLWMRALKTPRQPGLVAVLGDQVGGFDFIQAEAPAAVENVYITTLFPEPAVYDSPSESLFLRPEEFFRMEVSDCDTFMPSPVHVECQYFLTFGEAPTVRKAGGNPTAIVVASKSSNFAVQTVGGGTMGVNVLGDVMREYAFNVVDPVFNAGAWQVLWDNVNPDIFLAPTLHTWRTDSAYREQWLATFIADLNARAALTFWPTAPDYPEESQRSTGSLQAHLGANLFSRGALSDVMYGRAEVNSLGAGTVTSDWTSAWAMISNDANGAGFISGFDATKDLGVAADKRARIEQVASYLALKASSSDVKVNALGVPYGKNAVGWYALRNQNRSSVSLLAAERRWNQLGQLVDAFQTAADQTYKVKDAAERAATLQLIGTLNTGLQNAIGNTTEAATTLAQAAKVNAGTQQGALDEFKVGYDKLFDLNAQLLDQTTALWGCNPATDSNSCLQAAQNTLSKLEDDCFVDTGLDWLKPVLSIVSSKIPVLGAIESGLKGVTGKGFVDNMAAVMKATVPDGQPPQAPQISAAGTLISAEKQFANLETYLDSAADFSEAIRGIVERSKSTCDAGGQAAKNLNQFKTNLITFDNLMQNYANQMRLTHAQITSVLGMIGYLTSEGSAYETLANSNDALLADLQGDTQPLLDTLNAISGNGAYATISKQQRTFLVNACQTLVKASRTSLADLTLVSQALQTSTARTSTQPHLVVPAKPKYLFDNADPSVSGASPFDQEFGFRMSLWDDGAFSKRFTASGSGTTTNFMSEAIDRFEETMNGQVCENDAHKPATRFVVRKVLTGQALRTLVAQNKVDFSISLDDVVTGGNGNGGSRDVTARFARGLESGKFDVELGGAFVVNAGYSLCNGGAGKECCANCRVPVASLGAVAEGALNKVYLANRGRSYAPVATRTTCADGKPPTVSNVNLLLDGSPVRVSSCLTPLLAPRVNAGLSYFDGAGAPDEQVLNLQMQDQQCIVTASALASRPLQGLPIMGSWALARDASTATALGKTMVPAPISADSLPAVPKVTGIEVLFLVGTEPLETNETGGYGNPDATFQSVN